MIHMTHDRNHRRALLGFSFNHQGGFKLLFEHIFANNFYAVTHLLDHQCCRISINRLVDGGHDPKPHKGFDHFTGFNCHTLGKLSDGDHFTDFNFPRNKFGWLKFATLLIDL